MASPGLALGLATALAAAPAAAQMPERSTRFEASRRNHPARLVSPSANGVAEFPATRTDGLRQQAPADGAPVPRVLPTTLGAVGGGLLGGLVGFGVTAIVASGGLPDFNHMSEGDFYTAFFLGGALGTVIGMPLVSVVATELITGQK